MKKLIFLGLIEKVISYFCVGFTTIALLSYADDQTVNISKSVIVGGSLAIFQVVRFAYDAFRDFRETKSSAEGGFNG